jgi:hypothetical protein
MASVIKTQILAINGMFIKFLTRSCMEYEIKFAIEIIKDKFVKDQ